MPWTPGTMDKPTPIYLFRSKSSGPKHELGSYICAAPTDLVVEVYGGGGGHNGDGINAAFGGHILYRDEEGGQTFLAVWGRRYVSRFRVALRRKRDIVIVREPPPGRPVLQQTLDHRPPTSMQYGIDWKGLKGGEEAAA